MNSGLYRIEIIQNFHMIQGNVWTVYQHEKVRTNSDWGAAQHTVLSIDRVMNAS